MNLGKEHINQNVKLAGWVHTIRDHGKLVFIVLRDQYGLTQVVSSEDTSAFQTVQQLKAEYVVSVEGIVVLRSEETINLAIETGKLRLLLRISLYIINPCRYLLK